MDSTSIRSYVYSWLVSAIATFTFKRSATFFLIAELDGDYVFFNYSLIDSTLGRTYTVNLYTSKDNFTYPLQKVKGDIGIEIQPGVNKKIERNAKQEFGHTFE